MDTWLRLGALVAPIAAVFYVSSRFEAWVEAALGRDLAGLSMLADLLAATFGVLLALTLLRVAIPSLESSARAYAFRRADAVRVAAWLGARGPTGFATLMVGSGLSELELREALWDARRRGLVEELLEAGRSPRYQRTRASAA